MIRVQLIIVGDIQARNLLLSMSATKEMDILIVRLNTEKEAGTTLLKSEILSNSRPTMNSFIEKLQTLCSSSNFFLKHHEILDASTHHPKTTNKLKPIKDFNSIITVIGKEIKSVAFNDICQVLESHNIDIMSTRTLSDTKLSTARFAIELRTITENVEPFELKSALLSIADNHCIDIIFQPAKIYKTIKHVAIFDMDSTLIEQEVVDELAREAGVYEDVSKITNLAMEGEINFEESYSQRVALLKGLDDLTMKKVASRLVIRDGAKRLIQGLKQLGCKTAIVTGGFSYFAKYIQEKLDIDYVYSNDLETINGIVTGQVNHSILGPDRKGELIDEIARQSDCQNSNVMAVGDGANDLKMLKSAGLGIGYRGKKIVRESADASINIFGLDSILYLLGWDDKRLNELDNKQN